MYCVMVLSTICIVVLKLAGPFLVGLIVFYLSAGFFAVFFTSGFMELSRHMKTPELWAGMGRAVNNITAAVIANLVLTLLSSGSSIAVIVLVLFCLWLSASWLPHIPFKRKHLWNSLLQMQLMLSVRKKSCENSQKCFLSRKEKLRCSAVLSIQRTAFRQSLKACMFPDGLWNDIFPLSTKRPV